MQRTYLGIEIGGTKLQLVAGDESGGILKRARLEVDLTKGGAGIRDQVRARLPSLIMEWKPAAVGVGFGGPVDWKAGRIARSHQIEGWSGFDLGQWLVELTKLPVRVDNDATVFYVTLGSGVGGGCVVGGKIFHGARPGESEIGHLRLDKSGVIVEQRCSGWAVDAKIRRLKSEGIRSVLCDWLPATPGGEARLLAKALALGDAAAKEVLSDTVEDLAFGLSHVSHLFHPEVIVLGGGLSLLGEPLRLAVATALPRFVMEVFGTGPQIELAMLGEDAVPVGALLLAREAI
jgi:glucokinase